MGGTNFCGCLQRHFGAAQVGMGVYDFSSFMLLPLGSNGLHNLSAACRNWAAEAKWKHVFFLTHVTAPWSQWEHVGASTLSSLMPLFWDTFSLLGVLK